MARKLTRYKVNRQFRKNPTRSRVFFPYRLPFMSDFRLLRENGTEVSAATASRWRQVVADITNPNKRNRDDDRYAENIARGLDNVRRVQRKGMELALNGIPVGRSLAMFDARLAREIQTGFALHKKYDQLGLIKWYI
jgi:hypothetical protein